MDMSLKSDLTQTRIQLPSLGISIDPLNAEDVVDIIFKAANSADKQRSKLHKPIWISNFNLHGLYLYHSDAQFRADYAEASVFLIDGWPILAAASFRSRKWLGSDRRIGSSDWLDTLFERGEPLTITAIGASPRSSSVAANAIGVKHKAVTWYAFDGYGFERQDAVGGAFGITECVETSDLIVVGMGMPHQERWIVDNYPLLKGKIVANVGGCIDYLSGEQVVAPRWMGRFGLEWLYRLVRSPHRLARRYLVEPLQLIRLLVGRRN